MDTQQELDRTLQRQDFGSPAEYFRKVACRQFHPRTGCGERVAFVVRGCFDFSDKFAWQIRTNI